MRYWRMVERLFADYYCALNHWEKEFISEMHEFLQDDDELTDLQKKKIGEIYKKYCIDQVY